MKFCVSKPTAPPSPSDSSSVIRYPAFLGSTVRCFLLKFYFLFYFSLFLCVCVIYVCHRPFYPTLSLQHTRFAFSRSFHSSAPASTPNSRVRLYRCRTLCNFFCTSIPTLRLTGWGWKLVTPHLPRLASYIERNPYLILILVCYTLSFFFLFSFSLCLSFLSLCEERT